MKRRAVRAVVALDTAVPRTDVVPMLSNPAALSESAGSCPRCSSTLRSQVEDGVELDLCPGCLGMWFDAGELRKITGAEIELRDADPLSRDPDSAGPCPRCGSPLSEGFVVGGGDLRLDGCDHCSGFFLDAGEMAGVRRLQARRRRHAAGRDARLLRRFAADRAERAKRFAEDGHQPFDFEVRHAVFSIRGLFVLFFGVPVEEARPLERTPWVVIGLIAACLLAWWHELRIGFEQSLALYAMVPRRILSGHDLGTLVTSQFIHAGWIHLLGNLYFLWTFGDDVEDRLGSLPFLGWYVFWGATSQALSLLLVDPANAAIPHLGSSGAISGALGAYLVLFPRNGVLTTLPLLSWAGFVWRIPAGFFLFFWAGVQLLSGLAGLPAIGWWCHLGGFLGGVLTGVIVARSRRRT